MKEKYIFKAYRDGAIWFEALAERDPKSSKFLMRCPFHLEETSSFVFDANGYHCLSCGERGDRLMDVGNEIFLFPNLRER